MLEPALTEDLLHMDTETRGADIKRRAEALGIFGGRELTRAVEAVGVPVSRPTIDKVLNGDPVAERSYKRLEHALTLLENEMGNSLDAEGEMADVADEGHEEVPAVRLTLHDVYGIGEIVAEGGDPDAVVEALTKLMQQIPRSVQGQPPTTPQ